jgi:hypothetical protein
MKTRTTMLVACVAGLILGGCRTDKHTMVEPKEGTVVACTQCYNEVYKMKHSTEARRGATVTQSHTRHVCPDCKTEMSIYTENGVTKVRCAKCAPEGVDCDKCLPPKGWTPPPDSSATK